ncbi:MAG: hypothetical protein R2758_10050 [Bacteroidales bacterium]
MSASGPDCDRDVCHRAERDRADMTWDVCNRADCDRAGRLRPTGTSLT